VSEVKHKIITTHTIEADNLMAVTVTSDADGVWIRQGDDENLITHAAVPALIEALQAAAKEASDE
jgi:hypothetical protein